MAKHLAKLIMAGAQVVGRAFAQAVRQEIRMSQEAAKRNATAKNAESSTASAAETLRTGLTLDEAKQILNVEDVLDKERLEKNFKHLFDVNEKSKGGSFYLQSKVVRAKERIDQEEQLQQHRQGEQTNEEQTNKQ